MIQREIDRLLHENLYSGKAIILLGARQVGKTTILEKIAAEQPNSLWFNGDDPDTHALFESISSTRLQALFANKKLVIIDEAQRIKDIGIKLKLITDQIKDVQLIATGSSAFELANNINEPLTGRKWEYRMLPISYSEMVTHHGLLEERRLLPHRLIYGYYPEVVCNAGKEQAILRQLTDSYLYKDILAWGNIKKSDKLTKLLQALAFQVGNQVSNNELGQICGLDSKTIDSYLNLLEQAYVIFHLGTFSRNLRNELKQSKKYYFFDNGIRNALIANFNQPELRQDIGALWENFMIAERQKYILHTQLWVNQYYWRTKEQQEIDYIEDTNGRLYAFEFKWNPLAKAKFPSSFANAYPESEFKIIHQENFEEFILKK